MCRWQFEEKKKRAPKGDLVGRARKNVALIDPSLNIFLKLSSSYIIHLV